MDNFEDKKNYIPEPEESTGEVPASASGEVETAGVNQEPTPGYAPDSQDTAGYQDPAAGYAPDSQDTAGYQDPAAGYAPDSQDTAGYQDPAAGYAPDSQDTAGYQDPATGYAPNSQETPQQQYYQPPYNSAGTQQYPYQNQQYQGQFTPYQQVQGQPFTPVSYHYNQANENGSIEFAEIEKGKSERIPNNGFKVFVTILVIVLAAAIVASAGYIAGQNRSGGSGGSTFVQTDLANRPSGSLEEGTASYVYQQVVDSIVLIYVYSYDDKSTGSLASGVIYSEDGYIVTNDHIYGNIPNPQFLVTFADGSSLDAKYIAGDSRTDLAVLKVEGSGFKAATFGDSDQAIVGESVVAIGNPGGNNFNFSISEGIISAVNRWASNSSSYSMKFIQIDAAINSGSSGGALCNMYGQVIGITSWKYVGDDFENVAFAIPTTTVKNVCDSLIENGYVANRAKLGIKYQSINEVTARLNDFPSTGILVSEVTDGTPFAKAGITVGDMITAINGITITDSTIVLQVLENLHPGDTVTLTIVNSSRTFTAEVELVEDRGSSSYTTQTNNTASNTLPGGGGEFNFPDGE